MLLASSPAAVGATLYFDAILDVIFRRHSGSLPRTGYEDAALGRLGWLSRRSGRRLAASDPGARSIRSGPLRPGARRNREVPCGHAGLDGPDHRLGYLYPGPPLVLGLNQHPRCGCVISSVQHLLHGRLILPPLLAIPPIFRSQLPGLQRVALPCLEPPELFPDDRCSQNLTMIMPSSASVRSKPTISR